MTKKLFVSALALCAFTISMTAQNAPTAPAKVPTKTEAKTETKAKVKKTATTTSATTGAKTTTAATKDASATVKKPMNHKKDVKAKKAEKVGTN